MTLQLWVTAAVAIAGNVLVVVNGLMTARVTARHAARLAEQTRAIDQRNARRKEFDDACRQFLAAARMLSVSGESPGPVEEPAALAELRRAVAGIELYGPDLADGVVGAALAAIERLVELRSHGALSTAVEEAEAECRHAVAEARAQIALMPPGV